MDRGESPAFVVLTNASRRVFAAVEKAIGDGSNASVSYVDFRLDYHIGRKSVSPALKQLSALGLLDIQPGPRLVNVFRLSNGWRTITEAEAVRLSELAKQVKPHRTFERREPPTQKPVQKPVQVERVRYPERRMPSLPTRPRVDDG
jgi:hypothetical protein